MNRLLFGDNLGWLQDRGAFPDESVDLVYLDPPFNSNVDYNVIFRESTGEASRAQFHAFTDTWQWADAEETYREFVRTCPLVDAVTMLEAFHSALKTSPMMAYLAMMAPRLVELRRVLKPTGSIYLHCDPTASHYLKLLMDATFGPVSFRNEIIWRRTNAHNKLTKQYGPIHDVILFYSATPGKFYFQPGTRPQMRGYIKEWFTGEDERGAFRTNMLTGPGTRTGSSGKPWHGFDPTTVGRHWAIPASVRGVLPKAAEGWETQEVLDFLYKKGIVYIPRDGKGQPKYKQYVGEGGVPYQDIWAYQPYTQGALYGTDACIDEDVKWLGDEDERLDYQTQKPVGLLERIISSSCPPGGTVLDPFCGCGTTVAAAQKLKRPWTGIDITYLAINLVKRRLASAFGKVPFIEMGQPTDIMGAHHLAQLDRFQFQQWAVSLVDARPFREGSGKGADRGVDGLLHFYEAKNERRKILVQAKSGAVKRGDVATLLGDVGNQKAAGGLLITLDPPTAAMKKEAVEAGRYTSALWAKNDYPRIQILTVQGLLGGTEHPDTPPLEDPFAKAPPESTGEQLPLGAAGVPVVPKRRADPPAAQLSMPTMDDAPAPTFRRRPKSN